MPRRLDHLVICVRDLAQAALDWQTLGFSLTPTGVHPFGTSNRLAMFANNFLELLAVTDAASVPPAAPTNSASPPTTMIFWPPGKECRCLRCAAPMPMPMRRASKPSHRRLCAVRFRPRCGAAGRRHRACQVLTGLRHRSRHARDRVLHLPAAPSAKTVLEARISASSQRRLARDRGRDVGTGAGGASRFPRAHHGKRGRT